MTFKWKRKLLSHVWLFDSMDYTVHGILQARILEWVALPFSSGSSNPGIKSRCPALQADSLQVDSSYNLNKRGDNIQSWCIPFLIWNQTINKNKATKGCLTLQFGWNEILL